MGNMFTAEQVMAAHSKVRSGADFPAYIREIKAMGVTHYECYVEDGHIDYHGDNGHIAKVPATYEALPVADNADAAQFKTDLQAHQQGHSDFGTFIQAAASSGIAKWEIDIHKMSCTYFDMAGNMILTEHIPS